MGSGATGLATESVPSEDSDRRFLESSGDGTAHQFRCRPRLLQLSPRVRWDSGHGVNRWSPLLGRDSGCETLAEWFREIIAATVFEGENSGSQGTVVFTPRDRRALRGRGGDASQTELRRVVRCGAAERADIADARDCERPAWTTQTTVAAGEQMIAVWTHAGKQGLNCRNQRAPGLHGAYRIRMKSELEV